MGKERRKRLSEAEISRFLKTPGGVKVAEQIKDTFYKLHVAPYAEAQMIGTIRGLDFRVAELEAENAELRARLELLEVPPIRIFPN